MNVDAMKHKMLIFFIILLFLPFSLAAVQDISIKQPVYYDQIFSASAQLNPAEANVKCTFYVTDNNSDTFVYRFTDEFTNNLGFVSTSYYVVKEPIMKRDTNYNFTVTCGSDSNSTTFIVSQRETIEHTAASEFKWVFQKGNFDAVFIVGSIVLVVIIFLGLAFAIVKGVWK